MTEQPRTGGHDVEPDPRLVDERRSRMLDELEHDGVLKPAWRKVAERVPRHLFVPRFYEQVIGTDGMPYWTPVTAEHSGTGTWLEKVYSDTTLVTQLNGNDDSWDRLEPVLGGTPTSSSTLPSLVLRLLDLLDIDDGMRVLASGTGTGYTAALLAERLGGHQVTSIEADPALAEAARRRLARAGFRSTVHTGDGQLGLPANAPYDRVLATHAVRRIPLPWVEQTRPGGVILATLGGELGGFALARLTVTGPGAAAGEILEDTVNFMLARTEPVPTPAALLRARANGEQRSTDLDPDVLHDPAFRFTAQLALPDVTWIRTAEEGRETGHLLHLRDGSWASATQDGQVRQGGPRRLWATLEGAYRFWIDHDRPVPGRYRVQVTPAGTAVRLDPGPESAADA